MKFKTSMSKSNLRDFSDACFAVKGTIVFEGDSDDKTRNKNLITKNYTPFRSKINNTFVDNAEDFGIVMPMYNLIECNDSYCLTSGGL